MTTSPPTSSPTPVAAPVLPLILLPGMGADARLFKSQRAAFDHLVVPDWLEPRRRETLQGYAARLARSVDPGGPCIVGGASFGGFVATEMARHLDARAVVLIGSARSPNDFGVGLRLLRPFRFACAVVPFELVVVAAGAVADVGACLTPSTRRVLRQLAASEARFLRWASAATLRWHAAEPRAGVPVCQIHGGRDRILPCRAARVDEVVQTGGHVISLSHPHAVNAFLRRILSRHSGSADAFGASAAPAYHGPPKEELTPWPSTPPGS